MSPGEQAMLDEAADAGKLLSVSRAAQDCLRLVVYYDTMFVVEDAAVGREREREREREGGYGTLRGERALNVRNREAIWRVLREEIAGQFGIG